MIRMLMMIVAASLSIGLAGCKKEDPKPAMPDTSAVQDKAGDMQKDVAKTAEQGAMLKVEDVAKTAKTAEQGAMLKVENAAEDAQQ